MTEATTTTKWGARSIAALIVFVLAFLATPVALVGHWGHRTVNDAQQYLDTVGPLAASPQVQDSIAQVLTTQFEAAVDTESLVNEFINKIAPNVPALSNLVGPISSGIDGLVENAIRAFLASDAFQAIWLDLNKAAQKSLMALLSGESSGPVQLQGDTVVLDISSVFTSVQTALVDRGITLAEKLPIPQTDKQIPLMNAPQLAQARFIYSLTSPFFTWILLIAAALFVLAIVLSRNRGRMTLATGIVMVFWTVLIGILLAMGESTFINAFNGTVFAESAQVFWNTLLAYLHEGMKVFFVYGVLIAFAGWFVGRSHSGTKVRMWIENGLRSVLANVNNAFLSTVGTFVYRFRIAIRIIILAIGALIMSSGPSMNFTQLFWTLLWVAVTLIVVELLIGARERNAVTSQA